MAQLGSTFDSKSVQLSEFLEQVHDGELQVPNFQRDWVWKDHLISSLIASVSMPYPVGSILLLEASGGRQQFGARTVFGAPEAAKKRAGFLILDGQQRLTALYLALRAPHPKKLTRQSAKRRSVYYLDIKKCLDSKHPREDAVRSVPLNKSCWDESRNEDFSDDVSEAEYKARTFPLHMMFDDRRVKWIDGYKRYFKGKKVEINRIQKFVDQVLNSFLKYEFPTIVISNKAGRETVCRMFETINSRGVKLTVFDLLTAKFAVDKQDLREDWKERRSEIHKFNVLKGVRDIDFIKTVALLATYARNPDAAPRGAASCRRDDILGLEPSEYKREASRAERGFIDAHAFLGSEGILLRKDVPYRTQLVPLAALLAGLRGRTTPHLNRKLVQWFWCGALGELYAGATESRAGIDMGEVMEWAKNSAHEPSTCEEAHFAASELLAQAKQGSAIIKGLFALMKKEGCEDFIEGESVADMVANKKKIEYHHIFPGAYCEDKGYDRRYWNAIVNKTPIIAKTNRQIGSKAPSLYLAEIMESKNLKAKVLSGRLETHLICFDDLYGKDDFESFFENRARRLVKLIESALGKQVDGEVRYEDD